MLMRTTRFWYNLHQLRFWYNRHQLRFWYNLHQLRSISKDWKAILFKNNLKIPKGHSEAVNRQYNGQQKNDKQRSKNILWSKWTKQYTVEPAHGVTCTKKLPFFCPVIENFIWFKPLLRGHLYFKATFYLSQRRPHNTGLISQNRLMALVLIHYLEAAHIIHK